MRDAIVSEIYHGSLGYEGEEEEEEEEVVNNFKNDWKNATIDDINDRLRFGCYGYEINGQLGQIYGYTHL